MAGKYEKELEVAKKAAREAGKIINEFSERKEIRKEKKTSELDIVTEADRKCQEKIVKILEQNFPEDSVLGEEDLEVSGGERKWVIDPIDGTANFSRGFPYFSVSIGLRENGETKVGMVHSPESGLNQTFVAAKGSGAYRIFEGKREELSVSERTSIEGSIIYLSPARHRKNLQGVSAKVQRDFLNSEGDLRFIEGGALDLCMVAAGVFDGAIDFPQIWDIAGAMRILKEAGGEVHTEKLKNDEFMYCVASNGHLHEKLESKLDEAWEKASS